MTDESLKKLFLGRVIERRYRLHEFLAEGNFGAVFRGTHELFGQPVREIAVKIIKQTQLSQDDVHKVFGDGIMLAQVYDNIKNEEARAHIVPVYDMGQLQQPEYEGRGFIVMGLVKGTGTNESKFRTPSTLKDKMDLYRQGMPEELAKAYFSQICKGMAAVHELKVIHRDLKPDNILLTETDKVRIVDFGLAARLSTLNNVAGHAGTYTYMAPETYLRGTSSPRSDVYSMGIILYEMLTRKYPFKEVVAPIGSNATQKERADSEFRQRASYILPPPSHHDSIITKEMDRLVLSCLTFTEEARPADAGVLLELLAGKATQVVGANVPPHVLVPWKKWYDSNPDWKSDGECLRNVMTAKSARNLGDLHAKFALCCLKQGDNTAFMGAMKAVQSSIDSGLFLESRAERVAFYDLLAQEVSNPLMSRRYKQAANAERTKADSW